MVQCTQPNVYIKIHLLTVICKQKALQIYIFSQNNHKTWEVKNIFEWHLSRVVKSLDQSSKFSAAEMTKLENWCTICSFPLITMCQIFFLNTDYFLIYANYGVDHKTVSSSSMWLARGRREGIEEYFFVWVTQRWMVYCLMGLKRKKQLNSAISWRNYYIHF